MPSKNHLPKLIRMYQAKVPTDNDPIASNILDIDDPDLESIFELRDLSHLKKIAATNFLFNDTQRNDIKELIAKKMRRKVERIDIYNDEERSFFTTSTPEDPKK